MRKKFRESKSDCTMDNTRRTNHFNNTRMLMSAFFEDVFQQNFKIQNSVFMKYVIAIQRFYIFVQSEEYSLI